MNVRKLLYNTVVLDIFINTTYKKVQLGGFKGVYHCHSSVTDNWLETCPKWNSGAFFHKTQTIALLTSVRVALLSPEVKGINARLGTARGLI